MSVESRKRWRFTLKSKLLAVLIPLMAISFLVAMLGLGKFLHEFFQRSAESQTAQLGQAIQSALRQSMLRKQELNLSETLADLAKTPPVQGIWLINKNGRVIHAADRASVGRVFDKKHDVACRACHAERITQERLTLFTQNEAGTPIIRHLRPIPNEKACWGCHAAKDRLNGVLLIEESTHTYQEALWTVERHVGVTGGITLLVLASMTLLVSTVLVDRPVRRLISGIRRLGAGDLSVRVPVRGRDELAELAGSFNTMADNMDRSIEEIRNKNTELSVVYTIVERLTKSINLGELKGIVLQTLVDVLGADRVLLVSNAAGQGAQEVLMRKGDDSRVYRFRYAPESDGKLPEGFPSATVARWLEGELNGPSLSTDGKLIAIPVHIGEQQLGHLLVERERPFEQSEANPKLLGTLADHIGIALENARLYTLAITDELTQLFTVRHFWDRIEKGIVHGERGEEQWGLLMLDLDHFKAINDRWGHLAGDQVLRQVGQVLLSTIRVGDSAYRYGGEEFAVLLPEANLATMREVAERIRQTIERLEIPLDGKNIGVTVSVGVAIYPGHGISAQELVAAADAALFAAKRAGRNRVAEAPTRLWSALRNEKLGE
jgi:diguanylate cyclase (GGDEF)-like protein